MGHTLIQNWAHTQESVQEEIFKFNKDFSSGMKADDLAKIENRIDAQLKILIESNKQIEERRIELEKSWFTLNSPKVWIITALTVASVAATVAVMTYQTFFTEPQEDDGNDPNSRAKKITYGLGIFAQLFTGLSGWYEVTGFMNQNERSQLSELNRVGIANAEIFKQFVHKFTKIKKREEEKEAARKALSEKSANESILKEAKCKEKEKETMELIRRHSIGSGDINELKEQFKHDRKMEQCLKLYDSLQGGCKHDEVYFKILSFLISILPEHDSLRRKVDTCEKIGPPVKMNKPLPLLTDYLQSIKPDSESWENEQGIEIERSEENSGVREAYDREWKDLTDEIRKRLKVKKKHVQIDTETNKRLYKKGVLLKSPIPLAKSLTQLELEKKQQEKSPHIAIDIEALEREQQSKEKTHNY